LSPGPSRRGRRARRLERMPSLSDVAVTTALFGIYVSARGTARSLGAVQALMRVAP